jgi:two-component system sensor histidine kinase/response regulator
MNSKFDDQEPQTREGELTVQVTVEQFVSMRERIAELEHLQAENETLRAEQQRLFAELDAFAHTVAHQLQSSLMVMLGFTEVLEAEHSTMTSDLVEQAVQGIVRNGQKMSKIIDALLLLSTLRQEEVIVEPLDMAAIVADALERLAAMIDQRRAEIVLPAQWPVALGYAAWIEEIWVNYLSNGLKYGGRSPRLELGAELQDDSAVRFWVRDHGPGLTPEHQARLFIPFTRLPNVPNYGHGLGLSIVRRIVTKLNGQAGVESDGPGTGSRFYFALPASNANDIDNKHIQ